MSIKIKKITYISIITILFLIITVNQSFAQENTLINSISTQSHEFRQEVGLEYKPLEESIIDIINIALGLVGLFFLVMIIISGYQWMTSGGNEETITKAKKRLINSVIGVTIILCAYIIANWIMISIQEPADAGWWNL